MSPALRQEALLFVVCAGSREKTLPNSFLSEAVETET